LPALRRKRFSEVPSGQFDHNPFHTYNVHMIKFEWNPGKASANMKKHGISFEEAKSVFYDDLAIQFFDDDSSESEERFILLGVSNESNVLIVCHCERQDGEIIRIISARQATKHERKFYEGNLS
jgi:hypothetical protein